MIQVSERANFYHRNIKYASSKILLQLCLEDWLRQSTICSQIYVWIEEKEQITDLNNVVNLPREYTLNDTGLVTGKILPQEDSIRLLKVPTRTMDRSLAQTVNNLLADVFMIRGEGAGHRRQQRK